MCHMFSFYAAKTGEFYSLIDKTDEHSIIAAVFNLRDTDSAYYAQNLAKGEFTPPADTKLWSDLSKWTLTVDERGTPSWFDHEKAREYMERLIRPMFVTDTRQWLVGGCWILDGENASAKGVLGGRISGVINGANLTRANLYGATLDRANLDGANLDRANLYGANLTGATLTRATLYGANLDRANLDGANLYGATLTGATLYGATLYGATLTGATIHEGADLPDGWIRNDNGVITRKS